MQNIWGSKISTKSFLSCTIFRDKCIFAFCAEIQDAYKNGAKNNFWEKSPVDSTDTLGVKTFDKIVLSRTVFQDKCVYVFYTEIQDGLQKVVGK